VLTSSTLRFVADLPTPALLVDRARLAANLDAMQARADAAGVRLRPHAKTHKTVEIARMQLSRGAVGLTVATAGEAEAFAKAGFDDLRIATPLGAVNAARVAALAAAGTRLSCTVDTERGAHLLSDALASAAAEADVLIEIDTGHGRCGVPWDDPEVVALGAHAASLPGLRLVGVLTHGGHAYAGPDGGESADDARRRAMPQERDRALHAASRLGAGGLLDPATAEVSVGSTPTATAFEPATVDGFRVTEWRPGNYAFFDAEQVALGSATLEQCALTVLATVVSRHRRDDGTDRLITDAGKKALSADKSALLDTFGTVLYSPRTMLASPHARLVALSEEHGWIDVPGGAIHDVGDPVHIVPAHACMAVAHHAALHAVDGDEVVETWRTVGRR
jgi:D-serine deaminase-like pyridoxal phosphate-dependent protein